MIEQKLKNLLGEYSFQILALQEQLEEANTKLAEYEKAKLADTPKKEVK